MKTLEELAKKAFEEFCKRETSFNARWEYLSSERQLIWKHEIYELIYMILSELKTIVKPLPTNNSPHNTPSAMGMLEGIRKERIMFITLLENIHKQYKDELENK